MTTLMLVRAMEEERRRQVRPRGVPEPDQASEISKPRSRTWAEILGFPRLQPSNG